MYTIVINALQEDDFFFFSTLMTQPNIRVINGTFHDNKMIFLLYINSKSHYIYSLFMYTYLPSLCYMKQINVHMRYFKAFQTIESTRSTLLTPK